MKDEECTGYELSNCCGVWIFEDTDICSSCKEHCGNQCEDCEDKECENRKELEP